MQNTTLEILFTAFAGLSFGSFITLASFRLPQDENITTKPSRCPTCSARLGFKDLWPVLSWVMAGGKCRHCKSKVSIRYPIIELVTMALFLMLYAMYGLTAKAIVLALMVVALMIMIVADLEFFIIPDAVHLALAPLAFAYYWVSGLPFSDMASGFILGAGIGLSLHHGYRIIRHKEGLGFGDVKFLAIAGLWLGIKPLVPFLFFAGLFGTITGLVWRALKLGHIFPFGPSLAASLFVCVAFPNCVNLFWNIGQFVK